MIQVRLTHYTFSGVKSQTNGQRILFELKKKFFTLAREKQPCLEKTTAYIINIVSVAKKCDQIYEQCAC